MTLSIGKKIGIGFAVSLAALLTIGTMLNLNLRELNADSGWVTHTIQVQQKLESLLAEMLQAESTARGYELVPDASSRALFQTAMTKADQDYKSVRVLTQDNLNQQQRLDKLEPLLQARFQALQKLMELPVPNLGATDPQRSALVHEGRQAMDDIREILSQMLGEEQRLLTERQDKAATMAQMTSGTITYGTLGAFALIGLVGLVVTKSITYPLRVLGEGAGKIGGGNYAYRVGVRSKDEVGQLAGLFNTMASQIEHRQAMQAEQDWLKSSLAKFTALFQGQRNTAVVCPGILKELATLLDARHSVLYLPAQEEGETVLRLEASYAAADPAEILRSGEGLVGQCLVQKERIVLREIPEDYLKINSVLGEAGPTSVIIQPALFYGEVKAVIELAAFREFTALELNFLDHLSESIGIVLNTIEGIKRTEVLLEQAQVFSKHLQAQQDELSDKNTELEDQAQRLRVSEVQLQEQQEELKQTNEELEQANEEMQQIERGDGGKGESPRRRKRRRWSAPITRSSRRARRSRKKPEQVDARVQVTNRNFWPACPTNCARR